MLQAVGDKIHFRLLNEEQMSSGIIIDPKFNKNEYVWAEVLSVGDKVRDVAAGDIIRVRQIDGIELTDKTRIGHKDIVMMRGVESD